MWWIVAGVVGLGAALWGPIASQVEQAPFAVVESHGAIEIRDYASLIVAETEVAGDREAAINDGFRAIADYIFGNNTPARKTDAGADPERGMKVAMTAPVTQQGDGGAWTVRFVMPKGHTIDTLPKPNNDAVRLKMVAAKRFAVVRFSGLGNDESLKLKTGELTAFLDRQPGLKAVSPPVYAFYNPPWTLPFLRRNEVMVEIAKKPELHGQRIKTPVLHGRKIKCAPFTGEKTDSDHLTNTIIRRNYELGGGALFPDASLEVS